MTLFAEVVFPLPLSQSFMYSVPPEFENLIKAGARVKAPLGKKMQAGFIVRIHAHRPEGDIALKDIREVIDREPVISPRTLAFTHKLSSHYLSSWGEFLQATLPPSLELRMSVKVRLTEKGQEALHKKTLSKEEKKAAEILGMSSFSVFYLRKKSGARNISSLIQRMEKKGLIEVLEEKKKPGKKRTAVVTPGPTQLELDFSAGGPGVQKALNAMARPLDENTFAPFYLFGTPEERQAVYLRVIQRILSRSQQVLFLIPEMALLGPLKKAFHKRLGETAAFIHGQLSENARELEWRKIKDQKARVVVGPRSVLFSPAENSGLVIVDEEHDDSYVQSESPAYDARRAAWLRAAECRALLIYGSEIPSVEAFYKARNEGYLISLPASRIKRNVAVADDKSERGVLARRLQEDLRENLRAGRPSLVFLNRRGYASFVFCPRCGFIPKCDRCDISLVYYKKEEKLVCRYCNSSRPKTASCPQCGSRVMEPRGIGVEAVEEELRRLYPEARISSFDSDRVKSKAAREKTLERFKDGKIDILVGTQMLSHQSGLPPVSLIGILNPEALLAFSDFRASQKTFQALYRMMRFIAPDDDRAEIVIQTAFPDHYSIREAAAQDYSAFYDQEIELRRVMNYPPFSAMAEIVLLGREMRSLAQKARDLIRQVRALDRDIEILGPALAPPSARRGEKGIQVILKSRDSEALDACLAECSRTFTARKSVIRYD